MLGHENSLLKGTSQRAWSWLCTETGTERRGPFRRRERLALSQARAASSADLPRADRGAGEDVLRADVTRRAPPPDAYSVGLRARAHTIVWLTRPQLRCEARVRAFAVPAPAPQPCPAARRTSASPREPTRHGHAARLHRTPELQCPREGHPTLFQRLRPPPRNRPQKWVSRIWGSAPRGGGSPPKDRVDRGHGAAWQGLQNGGGASSARRGGRGSARRRLTTRPPVRGPRSAPPQVRFRGVRGLPRRRRRRLRAEQQGAVRRARDRRARPGPAPRPRWLQLRKPQ